MHEGDEGLANRENKLWIHQIDTAVYAGRLKDRDELMKSSSGGAFTAISNEFLKNGDGILCTAYDYQRHAAVFQLVLHPVQRDRARGSMYMQSDPVDSFREALQWLKNEPQKRLLFVGMGCQAEGFRRFAEMAGVRNRVWIVDIVCHGSLSPKLWRDYVQYLERTYSGSLSELSFKDKRNGWSHPTARAVVNGKEILLNDYVRVFYSHCALRPACHECPFAATERKTDMTIGDFWHIEEKMPEFYEEGGNSLFLIHTDRGMELFERIKDYLDYRSSTVADCQQRNLREPTPTSPCRAAFWQDYRKKGIVFIMNKYGNEQIYDKIKRKMKKILRGGGKHSRRC